MTGASNGPIATTASSRGPTVALRYILRQRGATDRRHYPVMRRADLLLPVDQLAHPRALLSSCDHDDRTSF